MLDTKTIEQKAAEFSRKTDIRWNSEAKMFSYYSGYVDCKKEYEEKLRWIPIKQRVPNENGRYLTKSNNGYINILSFKSNMWSTAGYQSDIEYWMHLSFL